ncbi:hypothetical protein ES703_45539 [subsurface metagenome]
MSGIGLPPGAGICPFNPSKTCPHQLHEKDPLWCQCCIMLEIVRALELIRATAS